MAGKRGKWAEDGETREERTARLKADFIDLMTHEPQSMSKAAVAIGTNPQRIRKWRDLDPEFDAAVEAVRLPSHRPHMSRERNIRQVVDLAKDHPKPDFATWRRQYLGRPVWPHQVPIVEAYMDQTNLVVIVLGPPGSGKDTTCGDLLLYDLCDDKVGLRTAWIMESESFARRRLGERIDPYLTDPRSYRHAPLGPDTSMPERSLIEDWGPYKWEPGMRFEDGARVTRTTWTKNEMYFVRVQAPEADPNLWATGINGATYGARVDRMFLSDPFTQRNQISPTTMAEQRGYIQGTLMSRLDESGRLVIMGTRISAGDNYGWWLKRLIGNARIIHEDGYYRKYSNGVATVVYPAIQVDNDGDEVSYWPERFPLDGQLVLPDGTTFLASGLEDGTVAQLVKQGARRIRGLYDIRSEDPDLFQTMYQQNPIIDNFGEFTTAILNHCDDEDRSIGVIRPGEELVLGVDPARTGGAGWVLWAVDYEDQTATVVDMFYGTKLGTAGIKNKLIIEPLLKFLPRWFVYEGNREAAILEFPDVMGAVRESQVNVVKLFTGRNRYQGEEAVAAMTIPMREGRIRFPARTLEDRNRMALLKEHFRNFDARTGSEGRTRSGQYSHLPDDLAMAARAGWTQCAKLLVVERQKFFGVRRRPVPGSVRRKWAKTQQHLNREREKDMMRVADDEPQHLADVFYGGGDA